MNVTIFSTMFTNANQSYRIRSQTGCYTEQDRQTKQTHFVHCHLQKRVQPLRGD